MDRSNFINQSYLNNNGSCGSDDCECDEANSANEKRGPGKAKPFLPVMIAMMAFVYAAFFSVIKNNANANNELVRIKKETAIACGVNSETGNKNKRKNYSDHKPAGNNNSNPCPHQWSTTCLACINDLKRKKNQLT